MIGEALRVEVEQYASRMRRENPFFCKAEAGSLTALPMGAYLANVREIVRFTPTGSRGRKNARSLSGIQACRSLRPESPRGAWS